MGFLGALWRIIMTAVVIVPKLWPVLKQLLGFALDAWAKRRVGAKRDEDLKKAAEIAEKEGDSSKLEDLSILGSGADVVTSSVVAHVETPLNASSSEPPPLDLDITQKIEIAASLAENLVEKKSLPLENPSPSEIPGWLTLSAKIASAGLGLAVLSAMFSRQESKAASMGFGGSQGGVIQDASGDIKNTTQFKGSLRMGSRLLPVLLVFFLVGCAHDLIERNEPNFSPKLYAADYKTQSIIRKRGMDVVRCDQPGFSDFVAMRYDQYVCMQKVIGACERFAEISCEE